MNNGKCSTPSSFAITPTSVESRPPETRFTKLTGEPPSSPRASSTMLPNRRNPSNGRIRQQSPERYSRFPHTERGGPACWVTATGHAPVADSPTHGHPVRRGRRSSPHGAEKDWPAWGRSPKRAVSRFRELALHFRRRTRTRGSFGIAHKFQRWS